VEDDVPSPVSLARFLRPQDAVWLALFTALALFGPSRTPLVILLLCLLGAAHVIEPKFPWFATRAGSAVSIVANLALCGILIGITGGVSSSYHWILLFPVVSAATKLGPLGTTLAALGACAMYLSSLLLVDWTYQYIPASQVPELLVRILMMPVLGFLTFQLAEAKRREARRYQKTAEQLAAANQSLREAEAEVRRSERLAALGQLSAGLAHELRNPLGTIRASAEMLRKSVDPSNEVAREMAGYIASEVDRTNSLVTRFLDFARPLQVRKTPADLTHVLDRAVVELENHQPPFDVVVYKNYSPDVPPVPMDSELMERVFVNLLINAAQASPPHAPITVKTRARDGFVEVSVIDRGSGIDSTHRENMFNPFYTTKRDGVGLGLPIVSKIVDGHGGMIEVESEPGNGSVFRILVPLQEAQ
jgi:signal transduction histidine kinase